MRRAPAVLLAGLTLLAPGCDSEPDARDRVADYIRAANVVQARWEASLKTANTAYADFAAGRLKGQDAAARLGRADGDLRAERDALTKITPPAEARPLHAKLLRVFDANLELSGETAKLAAYGPRAEQALSPLPAANRRLRRGLASAAGNAGAQGRVLGAFKRALDRVVTSLRRLAVPEVLRVTHGDRIRALARTASLSGKLRDALQVADAVRIADLLDRLDRPPPQAAERQALARAAVKEYNRRYGMITEAFQDARREEAALDRRLR
jgi:hypothetical protein